MSCRTDTAPGEPNLVFWVVAEIEDRIDKRRWDGAKLVADATPIME